MFTSSSLSSAHHVHDELQGLQLDVGPLSREVRARKMACAMWEITLGFEWVSAVIVPRVWLREWSGRGALWALAFGELCVGNCRLVFYYSSSSLSSRESGTCVSTVQSWWMVPESVYGFTLRF